MGDPGRRPATAVTECGQGTRQARERCDAATRAQASPAAGLWKRGRKAENVDRNLGRERDAPSWRGGAWRSSGEAGELDCNCGPAPRKRTPYQAQRVGTKLWHEHFMLLALAYSGPAWSRLQWLQVGAHQGAATWRCVRSAWPVPIQVALPRYQCIFSDTSRKHPRVRFALQTISSCEKLSPPSLVSLRRSGIRSVLSTVGCWSMLSTGQ